MNRISRFLHEILFAPSRDLPPLEKERLRRNRELAGAGLAFLLTLVLTWILFYLFNVGSALFIAVFCLNFLLLLGVALVVIRNSLNLVLERRRGVLGSRLRTRLTLACVGLTIGPCVLMFLITTKFVQLSVDFWFKDQIRSSMETALEVGRADYEKTGARLLSKARIITGLAREGEYSRGQMQALLEEERRGNNYALIGRLSPDQQEEIWLANPDSAAAWGTARSSLNWEALDRQGFQTLLESGLAADHVFGVLALKHGEEGYLVLAESMGQGFRDKLSRIASGATEYHQLWNIKRAMKWMLYVGLGTLTLLIILGAIWFGIRVAKEVTAPMLDLAAATQRIARGDLSVRLEEHSSDEAGILIRSFNSMAEDLEMGRENLTGAYKRLEDQNREIAQHNQYMETVLNTIDSGVISVDAAARINMVNKAASSILQDAPKKLLGRYLVDVLPGLEMLIQGMLSQFRRRPRSHWQRQVRFMVGETERRLLINAVGLATPEGKNRGFVAVLEDVSEMERMQRMEAWREVARRIAHEIKNPLTPIKLSAQRLQRKFGEELDDPAFSQSTSLIVKEVEALQEMVQEFSLFAKLPEVNPTPDAILPLLRELLDFFQGSHSRISWDLLAPEDLPLLPIDREALRRAFMNLFSNAAEALARVENGRVVVALGLHADRGVLRIDVADNGPGLTEEERSRLFEPYFSRKKGGTGLGLTIVKSIIADHNGYVRASSGSEGGAVLTVELPLV